MAVGRIVLLQLAIVCQLASATETTPTASVSTPSKCSEVMCMMFCEFGFATDSVTGCPVCRCVDPCAGVTCPANAACQPVQRNGIWSGSCSGVATPSVGCDAVTCAPNEVCRLVPVTCIRAPCPPQPTCVLIPMPTSPSYDIFQEQTSPRSLCLVDPAYGIKCQHFDMTAWFYNRTSGQCETFVYGGCGANSNNFPDASLCQRVCGVQAPSTLPTGPAIQPSSVTATRGAPAQNIPSTSNIPITMDACQDVQCPGASVCTTYGDSSRSAYCMVSITRNEATFIVPRLPEIPKDCRPLKNLNCQSSCPAGNYVVDENGCQTCDCNSPCKLLSCSNGCIIDIYFGDGVYSDMCIGDMCFIPYRASCNASTASSTSMVQPSTTMQSQSTGLSAESRFGGCCAFNELSTICQQSFCTYNWNVVTAAIGLQVQQCINSMTTIFGCMTGGVDETACCQGQGVSSECLQLCSGNTSLGSVDVISCVSFYPSILQCYSNSDSTPTSTSSQTMPSSSLPVPSTPITQMPSTTLIVPVTASATITEENRYRSCCASQGVSSTCQALCTYNSSSLQSIPMSVVIDCFRSINSIMTCATGGVDKMVCCSEKGVPMTCVGMCSGSVSQQPASLMACIPYFSNALSCYVDVTTTAAPLASTSAIGATSTVECSEVMCMMFCDFGFATDSVTGCPVCRCFDPCAEITCPANAVCEPVQRNGIWSGSCSATETTPTASVSTPSKCSEVMCMMFCDFGFATDSVTGCPVCRCFDPCAEITCPANAVCEPVERNGVWSGSCSATETTPTASVSTPSKCSEVMCMMFCDFGFATDSVTGCPVCRCFDPCAEITCPANAVCEPVERNGVWSGSCSATETTPTASVSTPSKCSEVMCMMFCDFGFATDSVTGCPVCRCFDPCAEITCPANAVCEPVERNGVWSGSCSATETTPTASVSTPSKCSEVMCMMFCDFGFATDSVTGCPVCQCFDPCAGVTCPANAACQPVQRNGIWSGSCSGASSPTSTMVPPARTDSHYRDCCATQGVSADCLPLCTYNSTALLNTPASLLYDCGGYFETAVECATGGVDRTQCCGEKGVASSCMGLCSGSLSQLPANRQYCLSSMLHALSCYSDNEAASTNTTAGLPSATTATTIAACPEIQCFIPACAYGLASDINGCEICQCADPCANVQCATGTTCHPVELNPPVLVGTGNGVRRIFTTYCITTVTAPVPITESRPTAACAMPMCTNQCTYGYARDAVTGCGTCNCIDPCKDVICPNSTVCRAEPAQNGYFSVSCVTASTTATGSSPSTPVPTRAACSPVMCAMYCEFNFATDPVTGCPVCKCFDPCEGVKCPAGSACVPFQRSDVWSGSCSATGSSSPSTTVPTSTPVSTPAVCSRVRCRMYCEFDFANDPVTGCPVCKCFDPCEAVTCPSNVRCRPVQTNGIWIGSCAGCSNEPCLLSCEYGNARDPQTGCSQCACHEPCGAIRCNTGTVCRPILQGEVWIGSCTDPRSTTTPPMTTSPTIICAQMKCAVNCQYGWAKDSNGCPTCDCIDPCQATGCPPTSVCEPKWASGRSSYVSNCISDTMYNVNGLLTINASFDLVNSIPDFRNQLAREFSDVVPVSSQYSVTITQLKSGSIIASYVVAVANNVTADDVAQQLSGCKTEITFELGGANYEVMLGDFWIQPPRYEIVTSTTPTATTHEIVTSTTPTATTREGESDRSRFLLLVILIPVISCVCLIIIIVFIVIMCKVYRSGHEILVSSRSTSIASESLSTEDLDVKCNLEKNLCQGYDNPHCVVIGEHKTAPVNMANMSSEA